MDTVKDALLSGFWETYVVSNVAVNSYPLPHIALGSPPSAHVSLELYDSIVHGQGDRKGHMNGSELFCQPVGFLLCSIVSFINISK